MLVQPASYDKSPCGELPAYLSPPPSAPQRSLGEWRAELMVHTRNSGVVPTIVGPDGVQVGWEGRG